MAGIGENNTENLYYYCSLSTAIEHILDKKQLRLSPFEGTNDPRENKSFVFAARYFPDNDPGDLELSNQLISDYLRQDCKVLCFSTDSSSYLSGYEYSRMWAYYGSKHTGVCLEIDKEEFRAENTDYISSEQFKKVVYEDFDPNLIPKKVDYTLKEKLGEERYLKEIFRIKYLDYLYFTKTREWESEKEFRLIYFSNEKDFEYVSINKSLKKVFLGVDFNNNYLPAIFGLTKGIAVNKLKYYGGRMNPELIHNF